MQTKLQVYVALAEDTARKITSDYLDWASSPWLPGCINTRTMTS